MKAVIAFTLILIVSGCNHSKKMAKEVLTGDIAKPVSAAEFDKQGHRGCRGLMPENTVRAMVYALGLGVTTLEMDVVITKDKKVILSHEPWMEADITTKPNGEYVTAAEAKSLNIYKMNYGEVKKYDVGMKPYPRFPQQQKLKAYKPLLSEVIDSVNEDMKTRRRPFPFYNIETKTTKEGDNINHPEPAEFVELLMAVIKDKGIGEQVIIQSFDFRTLRYLHKHYPEIKTAALVEGTDSRSIETLIKDLEFTPTIYSPAYNLANSSVIAACHNHKIKIIPWTVNDKASIERLKNMGVDGIITDYPNLFNE